MKSTNLLKDFRKVSVVHVQVNEFADEQINRRSLLLLDGSSNWRINVVYGVLNEHSLLLANVLNRLFALQGLQEWVHTRRSLGVSQEISAAILEQVTDDLNVHS
jgi:hypothetical protein